MVTAHPIECRMLAERRDAMRRERSGKQLAESDSIHHVAELLQVTPEVLALRLEHLHPAEVHMIRRRLACEPGDAGEGCPHVSRCREGLAARAANRE